MADLQKIVDDLSTLTVLEAAELAKLLEAAGVNGSVDPASFRRYGSGRKLYHFHIDNVGSY